MSSILLSLACVSLSFTDTAADPDKTIVRVELLAPRGKMGLESQQWAKVFDRLGLAVRIRSSLLDEEPEVTETTSGTLRFVSAIGELLPSGDIAFPGDHTFSLTNTAELSRWLDGLKVYGAAGAPAGGGWGLTGAGYAVLGGALAKSMPAPEQPTAARIAAALADATGLSVRLNTAAREYAFERCVWPGGDLPIGTATAIALESVGLGFAPNRLPSGQTELVIQIQDKSKTWPPGWKVPRGVPPVDLTPNLFARAELPAAATPLPEFATYVSDLTGVPVVPLDGELGAQAPGWKDLSIPGSSRPQSSILVLNRHLRKARLTREYRLDDRANAFLLIRVQDLTRDTKNLVPPPSVVSSRIKVLLSE